MAINKNRNLQFLRNSSIVTVDNHKEAVDNAKAKFATLPMEDGEIALYRYEIANEQVSTGVHTIVGVAHVTEVEGQQVKNIEILANYDHLTNIINALDANITTTSATEVTDASHAYVKINVVEEDGVITGITLTENIDETIAARIDEAIDSLDVEKVVVAKQENNVVTIYNVKEENGKIAQNGEAVVLEEVAFTGAAADVAVADAESVITATTVEGALTEIAKEIDGMDLPEETNGTLVKVTLEQVDGKITKFETNEEALETRLEELEAATTLEGVDAIEVNYDENGNGGTVSLKIVGGENPDKVLTQDENGLRVNLGLTWGDNTDNKITLTGKDGVEIASIDASKFIKDGMLEDVELVNVVKAEDGTITIDGKAVAEGESVQGITTSGRYFKFTWNTYTYNESGEATKTTKVEYLNVESLVDSYTAGNEWIVFNQDTNEISHKEVFTTEQQNGSVTTGEAATAGAHVEFAVPTIKVDEAGHVIDITDATVKVTLPSYIGTAVQTITAETNVLNNSEYVNVKAEKTATTEGAVEYKLTSTVKTQAVATAAAATEDAPAVDGLATALDVKQFVLDNSASVAATEGQTTVNKSNTQPYVYTVGLADVAQTNGTAASSFDDENNTFSFVKSINVDAKGRVTGFVTETVTENFDMGLYD